MSTEPGGPKHPSAQDSPAREAGIPPQAKPQEGTPTAEGRADTGMREGAGTRGEAERRTGEGDRQETGGMSGRAGSLLAMGESWVSVLVFGVVSLLLGLAVLAWPNATLTVIAVLLGIQLLIFGVVALARAIANEGDRARFATALLGVVALTVGVLVMRDGTRALTALALLLGLFWFVGGILTMLSAFMGGSRPGRGLLILTGFLGFVAGIIVLANPALSVMVLAAILGIWLVAFGALTIGTAYQMRSGSRGGSRRGREAAAAR